MPFTQTISVILNGGTNMRLGLTDGKQIEDKVVLKITKLNEDISGNDDKASKAENVKFYIQSTSGKNTGYVVQNGEEVSFVSSKSKATVFTTGSNGSFQAILPTGNTYKVIESENPSTRHTENIISAKFITQASTNAKITLNKNSSTGYKDNITITGMEAGFYDVQLIDDRTSGTPSGSTTRYIKGIVWIEKSNSAGKNNYTNQVYSSSEDYVLRGATVQLVKKSNNTVYTSSTTGSDGKYSLSYKSIDISQYYVRIKVSDSCRVYKNGSIAKDDDRNEIKFNSNAYVKVASQYDQDNGCKFMDYQSKAATTFTGTISDDSGSDTTTEEKDTAEDKYGLSGIYNNGQINNVNLGLKEISTSEKIEQVVKKAVITVNGYQYTYNYNTSGNNTSYGTNTITVNWQGKVGINAYTRDIYPSDIQAVSQNASEMEVKITYTIIITNLTKSSDYSPETDNSDGFYDSITCHEDYLVVSSGNLRNEFDSARYELSDSNWTSVSSTEAKYRGTINVEEDGKKKVDITFKVKNEAIKKILNHDYVVEDSPTKASMTAYHKWHEYLTWTVEKETDEGTEYITKHKTKNHTTESKYCEGTAPYFAFKLGDKNRTITGTVFEDEDNNTSDHELLGNGKYTSSRNEVENVKVELLKKSNGAKATLYYENGTTREAITYTDSSGGYEFKGIIPGEYYVRYTYGDGSQVIDDGTKVYASQFKSTIITRNNPAYDGDSGGEWYLYNRGEGYSLAIDNINDRKFQNSMNSTYGYGSYYEGLNNSKNKDVITADTSIFDVAVEFSTYSSDNWNISYPSFDDMNFGIIKMPVVSLNVYKTITHVTITLSNGQVITTGNPTSNISYISVLDDNDGFGFGRSGYVKGELDTQYLYGSTLQITYDIEVLNTSDINYKTEAYYKYGIKGTKEQEYTVFVDQVLDYLDPKLTYLYCEKRDLEIEDFDATNSGLQQKSVSSFVQASRDNANDEAFPSNERNFEKVLDIRTTDSNRELNTYHSTYTENQTNSSVTIISVTASKLLSTEDDDLEFKNVAEIVKITTDKDGNGNICRFMAPTASFEKTSDRDDEYRSDYRSDTTDVATITITPPTGISGNVIIFISIGIGLIIVAAGVIIIKKKIL